MDKPDRQSFTMRMTVEAYRLLTRLARRRGISRAAVIEQAIRTLAHQAGLEIEPPPPRDTEPLEQESP